MNKQKNAQQGITHNIVLIVIALIAVGGLSVVSYSNIKNNDQADNSDSALSADDAADSLDLDADNKGSLDEEGQDGSDKDQGQSDQSNTDESAVQQESSLTTPQGQSSPASNNSSGSSSEPEPEPQSTLKTVTDSVLGITIEYDSTDWVVETPVVSGTFSFGDYQSTAGDIAFGAIGQEFLQLSLGNVTNSSGVDLTEYAEFSRDLNEGIYSEENVELAYFSHEGRQWAAITTYIGTTGLTQFQTVISGEIKTFSYQVDSRTHYAALNIVGAILASV